MRRRRHGSRARRDKHLRAATSDYIPAISIAHSSNCPRPIRACKNAVTGKSWETAAAAAALTNRANRRGEDLFAHCRTRAGGGKGKTSACMTSFIVVSGDVISLSLTLMKEPPMLLLHARLHNMWGSLYSDA